MRIGLIVDHPKRDLAGIVMVAHEIAKRGGEAVIVPMYEQGVDIPRLGVDVVVANYARPANRILLQRYAAAGAKVFILDTEGGVLAESGGNSPTSQACAIRDSGYGRLLSGYLFWGHELYDAFVREQAMPAERLYVTGCPRFDYAAKQWRGLLARDSEGYLLVNANFPLVNPRYSVSSSREKETMLAAGWGTDYIDRLLAALHQIFPRYLSTIRDLAVARPDRAIVVRPHPFEREDPYRQALGDLANVTIDGSGDVLSVIHNAAAVLHLNCGTAIEAVMLEKLPIQLGFLDMPATAGHATLPARVSRNVSAMDELLTVVDNLAAETARFPFGEVYERYIFRFFHEPDGRAAARVADVLVGAANRAAAPWRSLSAAVVASRASPTAGQIAQGLASVVLGSAATSALRSRIDPRRLDKALALPELQRLLGRIAEHDRSRQVHVVRARGMPHGVPLASLRVMAG